MRGGCAPTRRYLDQSTASQRTQCGAAVALGIRDPFGLVWSCAWKGGDLGGRAQRPCGDVRCLQSGVHRVFPSIEAVLGAR